LFVFCFGFVSAFLLSFDPRLTVASWSLYLTRGATNIFKCGTLSFGLQTGALSLRQNADANLKVAVGSSLHFSTLALPRLSSPRLASPCNPFFAFIRFSIDIDIIE